MHLMHHSNNSIRVQITYGKEGSQTLSKDTKKAKKQRLAKYEQDQAVCGNISFLSYES